jgi:hypothetical protein
MKKIIFLFAFVFLAAISFGQGQLSILKLTKHFHITGNHAAAGVADSAIFIIQPEWDYSVQIWPHLAASADSIYSTVKAYQCNSDGTNVWSPIPKFNDNAAYTTAVFDTLVTANATNGAYWIKNMEEFMGVRLKIVITTLAKTNEDNDYTIYLIAKPSGTIAQIR